MFNTVLSIVFVLSCALGVTAESHTVRLVNNCGSGTPQFILGGKVVSTGEDYVSNGPINSAIAYLQNGDCLFNGEHCTLFETNINNPTCAGCGSSSDISLISPHAFNVGLAFEYFGGDGNTCDGLGAVCNDKNCDTAFFQPDDTSVQRACQSDDVGILITFCPSGATGFTEAVTGSLSGQTDGDSDSSSSSSKVSSASSTHTSTPAATKSSSTSSTAKATSTAQVAVNVGAASTVSSDPPASTSTPARMCSRRRSKRSYPPEIKRGHKRARALSHNLGHQKF